MKKKRRKEVLVNNTEIPEFAIERFARCVFDDIRADYENPVIRAEFLRWLEERENPWTKLPCVKGAVSEDD